VVSEGLIENVTPGSVLELAFPKPLDMSARVLARAIDVPPNRITDGYIF